MNYSVIVGKRKFFIYAALMYFLITFLSHYVILSDYYGYFLFKDYLKEIDFSFILKIYLIPLILFSLLIVLNKQVLIKSFSLFTLVYLVIIQTALFHFPDVPSYAPITDFFIRLLSNLLPGFNWIYSGIFELSSFLIALSVFIPTGLIIIAILKLNKTYTKIK